MRLLHYYEETIVDGPGLRFAFYFAGCRHACLGCHNKESWNPRAGEKITEERLTELFKLIKENPYLDGITLSGGDPLYDPEALLAFLKRLKQETQLPILLYTGYTIEQINADEMMRACLLYIDMVMDGKFEKDKRFPVKSFRGSWNQRLLYLKNGEVVNEQ